MLLTDRRQISLLTLREFKRINELLFHRASHDLRVNRSYLIPLYAFNVRNEI